MSAVARKQRPARRVTPAEQRRAAAALTHDDHAVLLRPFVPAKSGAEDSASIVRRKDQDFIANLLADLSSPQGLTRVQLAADRVDYKTRDGRAPDGALKLFQPVHRVFNVLVFEAVCDRPGHPRLDPRKIDSAGCVLRRANGSGWQAWLAADTGLRGWIDVQGSGLDDPDPARRPAALRAGHPEIDRQLALRKPFDHAVEQVTPLFVAPPEVCAAAGRTIVFGVLPVTSTERSETGAPTPRYGEDADERQAIADHLSHYLKAGNAFTLPRAAQTLSAAWADDATVKAEQALIEHNGDSARLGPFITLLNQLAVEFGALADADARSAEANTLYAKLNELVLPVREEMRAVWTGQRYETKAVVVETMHAGDFLKKAADVLLAHGDAGGQRMPLRWPAVSDAWAQGLLDAVLATLSARFAVIRPQTGRYDRIDARYSVRAFMRVRRDDGCAPKLVWAPRASETFAIAPWYDSAGTPPVKIDLPNIDRDFLKRLKPNIAFSLPPALANMLNGNDAKKLADGEGQAGGDWGVGWICSFSIPIITLCAFICLNIFLKLFDIIFSWMMFIKICIPYPKKGGD